MPLIFFEIEMVLKIGSPGPRWSNGVGQNGNSQKKTCESLKSLWLLFNLWPTFVNLHFRGPVTAQTIKDELHALVVFAQM